VPESWAQAAVALTLVVPGFVYRASWQSVAGPDPARPDFGTRVLHAMVATGVFAGAYAAAFGPVLARYAHDPSRVLSDPRTAGLGFIGLVIVVPWLTARLCFWVVRGDRFGLLTARTPPALRRGRPLDHPPSAWDRAFGGASRGCWVRVRFADDRWLGGWYGDDSFATTHPHPQELFVEEGWVVQDDGTFSDVVHAPGGMVIRCSAAIAVDFIPGRRDDGPGAHDDLRTVQPDG